MPLCLAGIAGSVATLLHDAVMNPAEGNALRWWEVLHLVRTEHALRHLGSLSPCFSDSAQLLTSSDRPVERNEFCLAVFLCLPRGCAASVWRIVTFQEYWRHLC